MSALSSSIPTTPPAVTPLFSAQQHAADQQSFARQLKQQTIACRLRLEKLGTRKALNAEQRREAAEPFGADHKSLSASKKLLDTKDPAFRAVRQILRRAKDYWRAHTSPYPDPGVRLLRKTEVEAFNKFMQEREAELSEATQQLQAKYPELRDRAMVALAALFNQGDYPNRIDSAFGIEWDFPSIDPPAYLRQINPELYEQEVKKIEARFAVAVDQAEQAFTQQFQELIAHLVDRLKGEADGKPKVFRDSAVENLNSFFEQFRNLDIGSNATLQKLVTRAQNATAGITAGELRDNDAVRNSVSGALTQIATQIDELMVNKPDRLIQLPEDDK